MQNKIYHLFLEETNPEYFIRIGENKNICLYVGKDNNAHYAIDFRGEFKPVKIVGSQVIEVSQFVLDNAHLVRFSLLDHELLECFSIFCQDLLDATWGVIDDETAYKLIHERYRLWKRMFKPNHGLMSETEIMGLIGELSFFRDNMIPNFGIDAALDAWSGPEKSHKDYSLNDTWFEIKSISSGKDSVRISSLEQLDSDVNGQLVVYSLEKMSSSFNGIRLNDLVQEILGLITVSIQRDLFLTKLELYGYDFSPEYDNYVYSLSNQATYEVKDGFPRLLRNNIPLSVSHIQYDLIISDIEQYKLPNT